MCGQSRQLQREGSYPATGSKMVGYRVLQIGVLLLSFSCIKKGATYPSECKNQQGSYIHCASIPLENLLDRVIQHAQLLYSVSEQSCSIFEEWFVPSSLRLQKYQTSCFNKELIITIPSSKPEVQKLSDKWLLQSVLLMVHSWIKPFFYLQSSLQQYDDTPAALLDKTKWMSEKLPTLEQGIVVLIKKVMDSASPLDDYQQTTNNIDFGSTAVESVLQKYMVLDCFRKDAHKIETFLKLLKCRWTDNGSCFQSEASLSMSGQLD